MLRMSVKMFLLRVNAVIYGQMDKAILAAVLSTEVLAHYDVAARFHGIVLVSMGLVSSVVLSTSAALHATGDYAGLKRLFLVGTRYTVACSVPLTIMLMVMARPLLSIWLGAGFEQDALLVWLFLAYTLFWPLKEVGWNLMIGMGYAGDVLRIQLWTTSLNLALSVYLTKRFGVPGVLLGTLAGNIVAMAWYFRLYLPALRLSFAEFVRGTVWPVYPQSLFAGGGLAVACLLRRPQSLAGVLAYAAAFGLVFLVLFVTTGVSASDRQSATVAFRRWRRREALEVPR
jgi:O-antigen/teichoic acid export membrane protein